MADEAQRGAVIVGVDGSPGARTAIRLAAREAAYRRAPLIAVMAYSGENALAAPATRPSATMRTCDDDRATAESALRNSVRAALGDQADAVQLQPLLGLAGRRLVETAAQAEATLIVLATRGSISLLIGTVSQYVLRNAPCPVLVVPAVSHAR